MRTRISSTKPLALVLLLLSATAGIATDAFAHCDTMNGPVVQDARRALDAGSVTPVLKWITEEDESEVAAAFARTLSVRAESPAARELADQYFFETVVRLHRQSEGVAYTGLKPATSVPPAIAAADAALESGDPTVLTNHLLTHLRAALETRFTAAHDAKAHAEHSVEAGRAFVEAYVLFTHLAEEIEALVTHPAEAGHAPETGSAGPSTGGTHGH